MRIFKYIIASVLIAFASCQNDDNTSNDGSANDSFSENWGSERSRNFIGMVTDTQHNPISGVTITIGSSQVQTDANGIFIINGATVYEKFAHVIAKKQGYIDGSRSMVPTTGTNKIEIMLLPNTPVETIQSGVASDVELPTGTKVEFDGAFEDESGNSYSGSVSVAMFHLSSGNENLDQLMPGMLYAQTQNNEEAMLQTFGMLNVELRGAAGQKLNLAEGHKATITMPIADAQIASSPTTIPLWHFDEDAGYWKEDGMATRVGANYVGEVGHFSWWNCDTFAATVSLTVTVVDDAGNFLSNVGVGLSVNATNFTSSILETNSSGQVAGLIPANEAITINLYTTCGLVYTAVVGPFSSDVMLPNIVISTTSEIRITTIQGVLTTCDGSPVTNGYILLDYNNQTSFAQVTNGSFTFQTLYCLSNPTFTLMGIDYDSGQVTGDISYNFSEGPTDIGNLQACDAVTEFVSYSFGDEHFFIGNNIQTQLGLGNPLWDGNGGPPIVFSIFANYTQNVNGLQIYTSDATLGNHTLDDSKIVIRSVLPNNGYSVITFDNMGTNINFYELKINKFGAVGDYMDVSFSGSATYETSDGTGTVTKELHGVAHVLRDY
jgi:hypothetical protein